MTVQYNVYTHMLNSNVTKVSAESTGTAAIRVVQLGDSCS
jgi:hypothetical protein